MPSICIIAGEASGDVQGALLVRALKEEIKSSNQDDFIFWGAAGPLLRAEGVEAFLKVEDLAVMGLTEICSQYLAISKFYKAIRHAIEIRRPDAVIFIDYPGFNLRLLQDVYALGITTVYHIPPKAWAHGESRAFILRDNSYLVTSILPFEIPFFEQKGVNISFVGNPLKDAVDDYLQKNKTVKIPYQVGIIPGSRKNEIKKNIPSLIEAFIKLYKAENKVTGVIPVANTLEIDFVKQITFQAGESFGVTKDWLLQYISFKDANAYEVMSSSSYAWVCSGTATLETAFFGTPFSVIYKASPFLYYVAKKLVNVKYISLVNLIVDREIVPEFIQKEVTADHLAGHALKIFSDKIYCDEMVKSLNKIKDEFPSHAGKNAAQKILETIKKYNLPISEKMKCRKTEILSQ